jgi:hypothetical protein
VDVGAVSNTSAVVTAAVVVTAAAVTTAAVVVTAAVTVAAASTIATSAAASTIAGSSSITAASTARRLPTIGSPTGGGLIVVPVAGFVVALDDIACHEASESNGNGSWEFHRCTFNGMLG